AYRGRRHARSDPPGRAEAKRAPLQLRPTHGPLSGWGMARPKNTPLTEDLSDLARLIARMRAGERRAISRVVTELERLSAAAPRLLKAMQPHLGHALVIGFTGPPGAGKSTLVNAYTTHLRGQGKTIGIIAVDPSSPVSGGAILGDRVRMTATLDDDGVFMRSLASRGHLGGVAPAAALG